MLHRRKQLGIDPTKACGQLRVRPIVLALVARDQLHSPRIGDNHFQSGSLSQAADPWRLAASFLNHACRPDAFEERRQLLGKHRDLALLVRHTARIEQAEVRVAVAQIESNCD